MLRLPLLLSLFACAMLVGCGATHVPVAGVVTVDGQPLTTGNVTFHPAATPGGNQVIAHSPIDAAGKYSLISPEGAGVQAGKYKVVVNAGAPSNPKDPYSLPILLVNKKFTDLATTPLTVDVAPGASPEKFNLALTK